MVNSANVRVTTGNSTADTILKWGFWIGIGLATYRLYRVVRYDDPFIQPSYRLPPAWEANPRKIGEEKRARAFELYEPGKPVGPVAKAVGVSINTIIRWMKEAGRYEPAPFGLRDLKYTEAYERALELYKPGKPVGPVAKAVGVDPTTIIDWMEKAGIYEAAPGGPPRGLKYTKEYKRALELYEPGDPVGPVAEVVGVHKDTIVRWMKEAGRYKGARVGGPRFTKDMAKKKRLVFSLYKPGKSVTPVAEAVGVDRSTVIRWMKEAGRYEAAPAGRQRGYSNYTGAYKRALELYKPGDPVGPVAEAVGVSSMTIINWMKKAGIYEAAPVARKRESSARGFGQKDLDEKRLLAFALYKPGKPVGPVAKAVGVSINTIIRWMKEAGRYEPTPTGRRLGQKDLDEKRALAFELYEPGKPVGPVAKAVGVSINAIIRWMKEAGRYEAAREGPRDTAAFKRALELYEPGKPVGPVAEAVGVSSVTIINWMKKAGIYEAAPLGRGFGQKALDEKRTLAFALYEPGEPVGPIAEAVGVSPMTIINWIKEAGRYEAAREGPRDTAAFKRALELYEPGKPVGPVAEAVGVSSVTIINWMKKAGVYEAAPCGGRVSRKKPSKNPCFMNGLRFFNVFCFC